MKTLPFILILCLTSIWQFSFSQTKTDSLIKELCGAEFYPFVNQSKEALVNLGKDAIPQLIELVKDTSYVKLKNTADLIYPGATNYYGHGYIIPYDIDWIFVRAGWVLEELTFEDFGFNQHPGQKNDLLYLLEYNRQLENSEKNTNPADFMDSTELEELMEYREQLATKVEKWWREKGEGWNRFEAIKSALRSNSSIRQRKALHFLRFEKTICKGLNRESYDKELKPLVMRLTSNGKDGVEKQAQLLLQDRVYYWLKNKK